MINMYIFKWSGKKHLLSFQPSAFIQKNYFCQLTKSAVKLFLTPAVFSHSTKNRLIAREDFGLLHYSDI